MITLLPREVEERLEQFMVAGKTGSLELYIDAGSVRKWKLSETGKIPLAKPGNVGS